MTDWERLPDIPLIDTGRHRAFIFDEKPIRGMWCQPGCRCKLPRGVLTADLLSHDGPYMHEAEQFTRSDIYR